MAPWSRGWSLRELGHRKPVSSNCCRWVPCRSSWRSQVAITAPMAPSLRCWCRIGRWHPLCSGSCSNGVLPQDRRQHLPHPGPVAGAPAAARPGHALPPGGTWWLVAGAHPAGPGRADPDAALAGGAARVAPAGKAGPHRRAVGLQPGPKVCARCIAMQIQDQCRSLAVPRSPAALQTAERLSLRTPMPTQPRLAVPR